MEFNLDPGGAEDGTHRGEISMCFLVATLALVIALFAGALVAPRTGEYSGLRIDPCALETGGWSMTDPVFGNADKDRVPNNCNEQCL